MKLIHALLSKGERGTLSKVQRVGELDCGRQSFTVSRLSPSRGFAGPAPEVV